jgi:peptidoglycan/xylan/chitin deacetylase (PgdA/CDA1 family)
VICLTGDVHHMSLKAKDQKYLKGTELDAALKYMQIANKYDIKATLFITGKCITEEPEKIEKLLRMKNLEIGGHNYYAFKPRLPFKIANRVFGVKNGPHFFQNWEVKKTLATITECTGNPVESWRNHSYRHDRNTVSILKKNGILFYSDYQDPDALTPYKKNNLNIVPINVLPDHDFVYHGSRIKGTIDERILLNTPFRSPACTIDQWFQKITDHILHIEEQGGLATLLIHPACMEVFDGFEVFNKICRFLAKYQNIWMNESSQLLCET